MLKRNKTFIFFICFLGLFPLEVLLQKRGYYNYNERDYNPVPSKAQTTANWKTAAIIVLGVLILGAICYGSNCLYICQILLCKRTENKYTKMDLTSQV